VVGRPPGHLTLTHFNGAQDGNDYAGEFRVVLPDGNQRWIASRGRGHPGANETPARMQGAAIDTTERKRTEEALRAIGVARAPASGNITRASADGAATGA
jgi:hypothetical protein